MIFYSIAHLTDNTDVSSSQLNNHHIHFISFADQGTKTETRPVSEREGRKKNMWGNSKDCTHF